MENKWWKRVYLTLIIAVFFLFLMIFAIYAMDCMSGGCAVAFLSIFLMISSFAVALLFLTYARTMDEILGGKNLLAHWVYPADEAQKSAEREFIDYKETNRGLLYIVGGFLVIAMVLMVIFGGEAGVTTAGILFIVLIIVVIVSVVAPRLEFKRALKASHEAYITDTGIIYEGAVYPFHSFLNSMDGASFIKETGKHPPLLVFSFMQLVGLYIPRPYEVCIPVPRGEEEKAQKIAGLLGGNTGADDAGPGPDRCRACGALLNPGEEFCWSCGEKAPDSEHQSPVQSLKCPSCGVPLKPGTKFCGSCGYKLQ